jgi:hypothetical protein
MRMNDDVGGEVAADRAWEATTEERLRRLERVRRAQTWIPAFPAPVRETDERADAFDLRVVLAIAEWLPLVERANPHAATAHEYARSLGHHLVTLPPIVNGR